VNKNRHSLFTKASKKIIYCVMSEESWAKKKKKRQEDRTITVSSRHPKSPPQEFLTREKDKRSNLNQWLPQTKANLI
jgi:hypothetical protein